MAINPLVINTFEGLFTRSEPAKVPPGRLVAAHNIRYREDTITPRPGLSMAITVPFSFTGPHILTTCPLIPGVVGQAYSVQLVATGGTPEYTWTAEGLPAGLSLTTGGLLSGTPEDEGTFSFEIQVTDASGITVTKNCSLSLDVAVGICASFPFEMTEVDLDGDFFINSRYTSTQVSLDPAEFSGYIQARFEAVLDNETNTLPSTIDIIDESDVLYATLSFPAVTFATGESRHRYVRKEVTFSLAAGPHSYRLRLNQADNDYRINEARIWVDCCDTVTAKVQILLVAGQDSTGGGQGNETDNDNDAYHTRTSSATYGYDTSNAAAHFDLFLKDDSKWATIDHWEMEVICRGTVAGTTGKVALFNATTGLQVANTEVTVTSTTITRAVVSFTNSETNFTNLEEFEARVKRSAGTGQVLFYRIALYAYLTNLTKAQIYIRTGSSFNGPAGTPFESLSGAWGSNVRFKYDSTKFTNTTFYFEATGKENGGAASMRLVSAGEADQLANDQTLYPTSVTEIDAGWTTPNNMIGAPDGAAATYDLTGPSENKSIRGDNFGFDATLPNDPNLVLAYIRLGPTWKIVDNSGFRTFVFSVSTLGLTFSSSSYAPANNVYHTLSIDALLPTTVRADMLDGTLTVTAKANQQDAAAAGTFSMDAFGLQVGYVLTTATLDFSTVARQRQRSGAITLTQDQRYIINFSSVGAQDVDEHGHSFIIAEVIH